MTMLLLGAHMSIAGGVSYGLDRAASVGSNAVQVFTKNNRQWKGPPLDGQDVARWNVEKSAQGIEHAISHASYLINLASPKDDLWEKSVVAHKDELIRAHAYGLPGVVLHPGAHVGSGVEAGIRRIAAALNRIHAETPDIKETQTYLELMAGQGSTIGRNFGELRQIMNQVDDARRVAVCVDTCHAFAAGYDLRDGSAYEGMLEEIAHTVGMDKVRCWHFNDSQGDLGSRVDRHVHIGEGKLGKAAFGRILNDRRWAGIPMLLETPKDDTLEEDAMNLARLCALVDDPSRIPPGLRRQG